MRYQETWIKGCPTKDAFQRECASRYEPIKAFLSQYKRPFSVFDFGANLGYFTFRIAEDFPHATVVAVDNRKELVELAKANGLSNVVVLGTRLDAPDLVKLAQCESFDVVLALNVLHHIKDCTRAFTALWALGQHLIVETPGAGDKGALQRGDHAKILEHAELFGTEIHRSAAHTTSGAERIMFHCKRKGHRFLTTQTLDADKRCAPQFEATIENTFDHCSIKIGNREARDFIPGMNLWNAVKMGMRWPLDAKQRVTDEIARLDASGQWHDDLRPWNFILSGDRAVAIDTNNKKWRKEPEPGGLQKCLDMIG